jgi:hypothetical protein
MVPGGAAGLQNQSGDRKVFGGFDSLPSPPLSGDSAGVHDRPTGRLQNVSTLPGGLTLIRHLFDGTGGLRQTEEISASRPSQASGKLEPLERRLFLATRRCQAVISYAEPATAKRLDAFNIHNRGCAAVVVDAAPDIRRKDEVAEFPWSVHTAVVRTKVVTVPEMPAFDLSRVWNKMPRRRQLLRPDRH